MPGGAPKGNQNAAKARLAYNALIKALKKRSGLEYTEPGREDYKILIDIWEKQIDQAIDGNPYSCSQIFDRLDGKPSQNVTGSIDHKHEHTAKSVQSTLEWLETLTGAGSDRPSEKPVSH